MFFASSSRSSKNQQQQCVCERVGGLRSEEKESGRGAVKTGRLLERREICMFSWRLPRVATVNKNECIRRESVHKL